MKIRLLYRATSLFFALLVFFGCKIKQQHEWDTNILTPLGNVELNVNDVLKDSMLHADSLKELKVIYNQELKSLTLGDLLYVKDTTLPKTVNLKQISLGASDLERNITLGEVAKNSGFTGQLIIISNGNKMVIPALNDISSGDVDINATSFFESATFIDGKLKLEIHNGFPIEITDIIMSVKNKNDKQRILKDTIKSIKPGQTISNIYSLAGKTVEGNLVANIENMNSPGSEGKQVLIDTSDALNIKISAYDMQVFKATAKFPAQDLVNDTAEVPYDMGDAELTFMRIRSGQIRVTAQHTIPDSLFLTYDIPNAKLKGVPLHVSSKVPPAPVGGSSKIADTIAIDGYNVDLTGRYHDKVNTFYNTLRLRIDSSGRLEHLSLEDSIYIRYGIYNVIPDYVRGYLGQQTFKIGLDTIAFDMLKNISGSLLLDNVLVNLEIKNGMGLPGNIYIETLRAINSKTKIIKPLTGSVLNTMIPVNPATDNPLKPTITSIKLDQNNSNIKDLLQILPDKFEYELKVETNPNGKTSTDQFVYYKSGINADLNIEMPLYASIKGLTIQDTFHLDEKQSTNTALGRIKKTTLYMQVENTFPFDMDMQFYLLNEINQITDSIFVSGKNHISAGVIDYQSGKVTAPSMSRIVVDINENQWNQLQRTKRMLTKAILDTKGSDKFKIYSNYGLKINMSAAFEYQAKF